MAVAEYVDDIVELFTGGDEHFYFGFVQVDIAQDGGVGKPLHVEHHGGERMVVEGPDGLVGGVDKIRHRLELRSVIADLVAFWGIEADEKNLSFQNVGFK